MLLRRTSGCELPTRSYVSLSEALSWLAFGMPLKSDALSVALDLGDSETIEKARLRLVKALDRVTDSAVDGRVRMRGKFVRDVGFDENRLRDQDISPEALHDFARFDVLNDGLNPGHGLAWRYSPDGLDMASFDQPNAAFRSIKVNRADLLNLTNKEKRASPYKTGRSPNRQAILDKADEMKARGMNGYQIASTMRFEPGFENVATTEVRSVIKGRWPRGPRKMLPIE